MRTNGRMQPFRSRRSAIKLAVGAAAVTLFGPRRSVAQAGSATSATRAGFIYLATPETNTWTDAHRQGAATAAQSVGMQTVDMYSVTGANAEATIRQMLDLGYDAVFSTSFDYADAVLKLAPQYRDKVFEQATGVTTAPNVGIYDGRIYQAWYLAGMAAGSVTSANSIGYVAPVPIPEVIRDMNAFTLGVLAVNPAARVQPGWAGTFFDPARERAAAQSLIKQGVDVIARESDTTQPEEVAAENGIWAVGYNTSPSPRLANTVLTAPIWNWLVYYAGAFADLLAGSWSNAAVWWGFPEGLVDIAPVNPVVPQSARTSIASTKTALVDGSFDVFAGPVSDNTGQVRVAAGSTLSDSQLLTIDWLVNGIAGSIPTSR